MPDDGYDCYFVFPGNPVFEVIVPNPYARFLGDDGKPRPELKSVLSGYAPCLQDYDQSYFQKPKDPKPVDPNTLVTEAFHHSSFLGGKSVSCAGEIKCKNGQLELISNASGHYKPPEEFLQQVFMELNDNGYDFSRAVDMELAAHGDKASTIKKVDTKAIMIFRKELLEKGKSRSYTPDQKEVDQEKYGNEEIVSRTIGKKVRYLKPEEVKKLQVKVQNKLLMVDGKPFNTYGGLVYGRPLMRDRFIFVMAPDGEIYAADVLKMMAFVQGPATENYKKDLFSHSIDKRD